MTPSKLPNSSLLTPTTISQSIVEIVPFTSSVSPSDTSTTLSLTNTNASTSEPLLPQHSRAPSSSSHPMITRSKNNIFKPKQLHTIVTRHSLPPFIEPTCVTRALKHQEWRQAMPDEFNDLLRNDTWELVPLSST
ncbi:hypothetical protein Scep_012296 [Stephania cephalantha]|uniref:Uncharacterized protein n=1 Tax=Stephania cephalantha TaxID=152367 RepID=A0AAP0JGM9_9MAGN